MHRGYTRERYLGIIERLRAARPDMGITTDLIVGFPGETKAHFDTLTDFITETRFERLGVFL